MMAHTRTSSPFKFCLLSFCFNSNALLFGRLVKQKNNKALHMIKQWKIYLLFVMKTFKIIISQCSAI